MNFSRSIYSAANSTVYATGSATLWCPSDGQIAGKRISARPVWRQPESDGRFHQLCGMHGHVVAGDARLLPGHCIRSRWQVARLTQAIMNTLNGVYIYNSPPKIAGITDGTSNTLLYGEHGQRPIHPGGFRPASTGGATPSPLTPYSPRFTR